MREKIYYVILFLLIVLFIGLSFYENETAVKKEESLSISEYIQVADAIDSYTGYLTTPENENLENTFHNVLSSDFVESINSGETTIEKKDSHLVDYEFKKLSQKDNRLSILAYIQYQDIEEDNPVYQDEVVFTFVLENGTYAIDNTNMTERIFIE